MSVIAFVSLNGSVDNLAEWSVSKRGGF